MRQILVRLFQTPGWTEIPDADWKSLKLYVDRHQFVNEIGEKISVYKLNDRGEDIAKRILLKRGHAVEEGCGVAIQDRTWSSVDTYQGDFEDLVSAIEELQDIVEPPVRIKSHPQGCLIQFADAEATCLEFSTYLGWERHQVFGDELKHDVSDALQWLWGTTLVDLRGVYQEIVLWNT